MREITIEDHVVVKDLMMGGVRLSDAEVAYESSCGEYRLYVVASKEDEQFSFAALRQVTAYSNWFSEPAQADVLFMGTAIFDGVRHMNFTNYVHCVNVSEVAAMLDAISKLEQEICPEA